MFTAEEVAHAALVVSVVAPIVEPLAAAMPRTEVVLHELTRLPHTIAAVAGSLTGRQVGGPPTDLGLRVFGAGWSEHLVGYRTEDASGRQMRSSSIFFYAPTGRPVACLCMNTDINDLQRAREVLAALTATTTLGGAAAGAPGAPSETFALSIETLADGILRDAISAVEVPVNLMKKAHKLAIVRDLDARGFFAIREAVDLVAQRLEVSRFTIYNYLKELDGEGGAGKDGGGPEPAVPVAAVTHSE